MGGFSFDALPVPAMVLELDGTVLAANRAIARGAELVGRNVRAIVPSLGARWGDLVDAARRDGNAVDEVTTDGPPPRHFQFMLALAAEDGRPVLHGIAIDITTHREEAAQARARLDAEHRLAIQQRLDGLGLVAGGVAHDFNNLLVSVLAEASAAREDATLGTDAHEALRRIEAAARRMALLTRQLLAYAGRAQVAMAAVDADALVDELRDHLARLVRRDARLAIAAGAPGAVVEADPTLLRQVVTNLVANASEAGSSQIEVATAVVTAAGSAWWQLEIADDGPGIDTATLPHIFEPFFSTKRERHGLGLSAVHGIVRRLGGTIEVTSRPGGGARFVVRIPVIPDGTPARRPSEPASAAAPALAAVRVLVADDEPLVRASVRRLLERRGATVTVAGGVDDAIACVRGAAFDLVVVDVSMPGGSGHDVLEAVRASQPGVPVVLMSGYTERTRGWGGEDVPDEFIEKPFTASAFDAVIARVLARR